MWIYMVGNKPSGKADQLTLGCGSSENTYLFSVAISLENKMNLSLYVAGLHITHVHVGWWTERYWTSI